MPVESNIAVTVGSRSGESNQSQLKILRWSEAERKKRALKTFGIGFGIAFVSIFIPLAHFILVPGALISTPIVAWIIFKQESYIPKQSISCPKCNAAIMLPAIYKITDTTSLCDACRQVITLKFMS